MKIGLRSLGATLSMWAILSFAGCSFHSTQYEFIKSLVKKGQSGPKKNWIIEWNGFRTPVYAVNATGYVFFVDEFGVEVKYQDSQVTEVKGLLLGEDGKGFAVEVMLLSAEVKLGYRFLGGSTSEVHSCSLWIPRNKTSLKEPDTSMWVQNCAYQKFKYQNRRWLNDKGQLVRLEYLLKRGYPHANIFIL